MISLASIVRGTCEVVAASREPCGGAMVSVYLETSRSMGVELIALPLPLRAGRVGHVHREVITTETASSPWRWSELS